MIAEAIPSAISAYFPDLIDTALRSFVMSGDARSRSA